MNEKNTEFLRKTYPELYKNLFNFACGDGWFPLVEKLSKDIKTVMDKTGCSCEVSDVKEKYGTLRVYTESSIPEIDKLIDKTEGESSKICEKCGDPGALRGTCWVSTLCDKCMRK